MEELKTIIDVFKRDVSNNPNAPITNSDILRLLEMIKDELVTINDEKDKFRRIFNA